ncbi:MAG: hypothetical protein LBJ23_06795 [Tannerella sp.]|jgi:hypothetical protein|nr:hypothetical protein [Tannerella sp.]
MHYNSYQPAKDGEFIVWAQNICSKCVANQTAWNLSKDEVTEFTDLESDAAYAADQNPETKNRQTKRRKQKAFADLKEFMARFTNAMEYNTAIPDNDIEAMGLRPRAHHHHEPDKIPDEAPGATVVTGQHHDMDIYASVPQFGHATEYLKRKGYYGIVVRTRKDGEEEWHDQYSTRLHVTMIFDAEDEGKYLTITVAWINPRMQAGPWSDEIHTLIN